MWFWVFCIFAALSFTGFFLHSVRHNGHGMIYAAVLAIVWVGLALWTGGYLNG